MTLGRPGAPPPPPPPGSRAAGVLAVEAALAPEHCRAAAALCGLHRSRSRHARLLIATVLWRRGWSPFSPEERAPTCMESVHAGARGSAAWPHISTSPCNRCPWVGACRTTTMLESISATGRGAARYGTQYQHGHGSTYRLERGYVEPWQDSRTIPVARYQAGARTESVQRLC
jgi:hypothetical protein